MTLKKAVEDLRYLLDRGYKKRVALDFVANHYMLKRRDRNYLARYVFSESTIRDRKKKIASPESLRGSGIILDGYNVLITVESVLQGNFFIAQDGFLRDSRGVFGKYKLNDETLKALELVFKALKVLKVGFVKFYFDKNVSFSGELASIVRRLLKDYGIPGEVELSPNVDYNIKRESEDFVVATSDSAIIDRAERVFDIPFFIWKYLIGDQEEAKKE
ncbi:MAG TPA: DUF434 domain-containing protein [Methanothermobacter sp.]|uniref:DUF434 domain-containing protein n=1 Tax=Methanothermobacter tenebrarum TaxID=680118 RepID=A0ABN6PEZ7_9EURY|nr:DUF434 domain-containing protein [Methanothermobacter tenebrarum]MBK6586649.1 DUF434 domain-containing protein [Coprothermobacter sp.]MDD3454060.1 DUF434 domain-containing protein [Methanobacteriales archaeon]MDI6882124.1 DUF434 domain-containing protein [Methanothermobacter sp.]BDH80048.1 hypothetical protein MTTB_14270 [Methanothermobacter tenebrarum]HHW16398.1 DUF434 domain-containing protein [Methanothermobacter sp.]